MRLIDKIAQHEQINEQPVTDKKKSPVTQMTSKNVFKDKVISAKVNSSMYATFTAINQAQGLSNNSALNMIMSEYVRSNKHILDEEL